MIFFPQNMATLGHFFQKYSLYESQHLFWQVAKYPVWQLGTVGSTQISKT